MDLIVEITWIYYSLVDPKIDKFVSGKILEEYVNDKFNQQFHKLNTSDPFYEIKLSSIKQQLNEGLAENVNKANVITISVNPKEYLEKFEDLSINKKHKGIKKGTRGMTFDAYCSKLASITEFYDNQIKPTKKVEQKRFQIINDAMQMNTVSKIQFGQLNDKRFYFPNRIVSLPFGHFLFDELRKEKTQNRKIHLQIKERKWDLMKKENEVLNKNERLSVLCQIINGCPKLYLLNKDFWTFSFLQSTKEYIISNLWR